jgi:predicted component of type VI protein secretion system
MKKVLLVGVVLSVLCGCATTPVSIKDAKQMPKDRLLAFQTKDANKTATLTVIRDEGFLGSGCYYGLWINQTLAARVDVAEFAKFYVEPGEILLRIGRDPQGQGLCGIDQDNWTQRETIMKPGDQKTFRMTIDENAKLDIFRSDIDQTK